ncbi:MAG TPA: phosphatase PAP2 family protein [Acidimicrobiales bacterium]|nr:phosphatase PAP2 family protein [Acidimicrobiales bacterium]
MLLNHRRALRLVGVLGVLTVVVFLVVGTDPNRGFVQDIDDGFLETMVDARFTPLVWLAEAMAFAGSVWVNWPVRVVVMVLLGVKRRWLQLSAFVLAVATSEPLIGLLKALYERPRPPEGLLSTDSFSFPSGHAIAGAVTAVGIVIVLLPPGPRRWRWEMQAAVFAGLMALSRTYLGVHWLSDVVAGTLLGVTVAVGWPALLQEIRERRMRSRAAAIGSAPPPADLAPEAL